MNKFNIYCLSLKEFTFFKYLPSNIIPLILGSNFASKKYLNEGVGDNLKSYNKFFGELTGIESDGHSLHRSGSQGHSVVGARPAITVNFNSAHCCTGLGPVHFFTCFKRFVTIFTSVITLLD